MAAHVKSFLKGVMLCLSPRFHGGGGFRDDKDSRVVGLLVGGENEKALAVGRIAVGHAVHDFSVEEIHPYFQTGVIEFEVLHGELFVRFVILVAAEVFHEEDGLDEGGEHRDDVLVIFESCDVEAVFGGGEIECAALDNLSVPKMNNHPMLYHPGALPSQVAPLQVVLLIYSARGSYAFNGKTASRKESLWVNSPIGTGRPWFLALYVVLRIQHWIGL
jgi:hypothetical protein